ncbi:MAG TPA: hypothetical protein PLN05_14760 [Pyrinomonadaceae bacterium]|nr:hypothetical protein [Pyrinomonadaceae bacterium]HRK51686.1 hypothetical protein [Pyrinomonadaceae bacterium]
MTSVNNLRAKNTKFLGVNRLRICNGDDMRVYGDWFDLELDDWPLDFTRYFDGPANGDVLYELVSNRIAIFDDIIAAQFDREDGFPDSHFPISQNAGRPIRLELDDTIGLIVTVHGVGLPPMFQVGSSKGF